MQRLARFTAITGISFIINMIMLVARSKALALLLAPEGVGLLAQINTLDGMLSTFASVGIGYGIINLVARYAGERNDSSDAADASATGILLSMVISVLIVGGLIAGSSLLSDLLLGSRDLAILFVLLALALPFNYANAAYGSILQGLKAITPLARARSIGAVLGALSTILLTWRMGLIGAVLGIAAWSVFFFIASRIALDREWRIKGGKSGKGSFRKEFAGEILRFGFANLLILSMNYLAVIIIRSQIVHISGAAQNGIYQVVWAMSSQYLILVSLSLWSYSYPRITELIDSLDSLTAELSRVLRLGLLLIGPLIFLIVANRDYVIRLLYTVEFLPASGLILIQAWGDLFRFVLWWVELPLYARGELRSIVALEALRNLGYLILSSVLLSSRGLAGVCISYALINGLTAALAILIFSKRREYKFGISNYGAFLQVAILVFIGGLLPQAQIGWTFAGLLLLLIWGLWVLKREELYKLREIIGQYLPQKK